MAKAESTEVKKFQFSIIDLMMMIMVIGVICTIYIPVHQSNLHQKYVRESLKDVATIINANEVYKRNDEFGEYAWDLAQLNLKLDSSIFKYTLTDSTIVARSDKLAREETSYYYDIKTRKFHVEDGSEEVIFKAWLP